MLADDGIADFFFIQHNDANDRWRNSSLEHFFFSELSYSDSRGEVGDRFRTLMKPQSATSDLWQKFGVYGYEDQIEAEATLEALREHRPDKEFRLVHRVITQESKVVPG